jgi:hypothetical protein
MSIEAVFGLSIVLSFLAFGTVTALYIRPRLDALAPADALTALVAPHMFRFVGLSFLVPGVVSAALAPAFAVPAAYGDLIAAVLAMLAVWALVARAAFAVPLVWLFNLWGTADLLVAIYQGQIGVQIGPGSLGAAFFIPTVIVPPLLITHGLVFRALLR